MFEITVTKKEKLPIPDELQVSWDRDLPMPENNLVEIGGGTYYIERWNRHNLFDSLPTIPPRTTMFLRKATPCVK